MARRKIPEDAFYYYVSRGAQASYEDVAKRYGVTKRAVVRVATKERWQERARELEREAQARTRERAIESLEAMNERHLKSVRVVQARAIEALRAMPLDTAMGAVRALDLAIKQERAIRGEPAEGAVDIEAVIRREYERWMEPDAHEGDDRRAGNAP
jgi:hypothetical protein